MIFTITNQIASRLDHVWLARAALTGILHYIKVSETEVPLLQVALSEVINNTIEHSYYQDAGNIVEIRVQIEGQNLQIDILDDAPALSAEDINRILEGPAMSEEPDEDWSMRGHGLQIVRRIVDSIDVARIGSRNCITLRKKLSSITLEGSNEPESSYSN